MLNTLSNIMNAAEDILENPIQCARYKVKAQRIDLKKHECTCTLTGGMMIHPLIKCKHKV